jgi:MFS family permease
MSLELTGRMSAHGRGDLLSFILLYTTLYAGFGVVSPFLPTLLQSRGLQPDQIGLVLALSTGVRLVSGPLAGRIADLYGALRAVFAAPRWQPLLPRPTRRVRIYLLNCPLALTM